jgi:hypothetical protein
MSMNIPTRGSKPEVFERRRKLDKLRLSQTLGRSFIPPAALLRRTAFLRPRPPQNFRNLSIEAPLSPIAPLARSLICGSVAHLRRNTTLQKARAAYQQFFAIWKEVDPDICLLKQAKAEYGKLQWWNEFESIRQSGYS